MNETMSGRRREEGDGKVSFSFDRVFPPQTSQADVFEEISQLIQVRLSRTAGLGTCLVNLMHVGDRLLAIQGL